MKHVGPISGIATHGETFIATSGYDNQVILWNAQDKTALGRVYHDHLANQCAFNSAGNLLVSASSDYSARLWTVPDMKLVAVLNGHEDDVEMAAFSPDGSLIATCSRDRTIGIFSLDGQRQQVLRGHDADVISVAWTDDGTELLSSSDDGTIRRWDAETGAQIDLIDQDGVETDTIVIRADGAIYSGDDEGRISIFKDNTARTVDAHNAGIKRLIYSANRGLLASLSYDRTLCIWETAPNGGLSLKQSTTFPSIIWPRSGAFLNGHEMVFGTFGSTYATYDIRQDSWSTQDVQPDDSINAVTRCSDGRTAWIGDAGQCHFTGGETIQIPSLCNFLLPVRDIILSAGQTGEIFDVRTGTKIHTHRSPINCATTFKRNGDTYAVLGAYTGEGVILRLAEDGRTASHVQDMQLHSNAVKGIASDEKHIFSVSADGASAWHRIADLTSDCLLETGHSMIANGCTKVKEGVFASVSRDLKLRLWNELGRCRVIDTPHKNSIKCIASSADGRFIATGSYFGVVAVYDVDRGTWTTETRPSSAGISSIIAVPGNECFLCSSYDGEIHEVAASNKPKLSRQPC
jgi:WD40 repeat protein